MRICDEDLSFACRHALAVHSLVPHLQLQLAVENGWVRVTGRVSWDYQRTAAMTALEQVRGVRGVTDAIEVENPTSATEIRDRIASAFKEIAELDAMGITIEARDGKVILGGAVHSQAEKEQACRAACANGVVVVEDHLTVIK